MLTNDKIARYDGGNQDLIGGYLHRINADNHYNNLKCLEKGKKTPVSCIRKVQGSYPIRAMINTGAILSNQQNCLRITNWRLNMPKLSNTAVSQPQSIQKSFGNVALAIIPDQVHEFILSTAEVARGYGATINAIRQCKQRHSDEILENIHFLSRVTKCNSRENLQRKQIFWTKRGVVKLGFFVKSDIAKDFRTWAENLIVNSSQPSIAPKIPTVSLPNLTQVADGVFYLNEGVPCKRFYNYRFTEDFIIKLLIRKISFISEQISQKEWREYSNALKTVNRLTGETLYHPQAVEKAALLWDVDYLTELLINKK